MGPDRTRELYELSLRAHRLVDAVCAAAGPEARFLVMDESPIVLAYVGLKEGETGPQAASARLDAQQAMNKHLHALAGQVRSLKPARSAARPAGKKPAAKKPAKKKTGTKKKSVPKKKKAAGKTGKKAAKKKK